MDPEDSRIQDECLYEVKLSASCFREMGESTEGFCKMLMGGRARWVEVVVDVIVVVGAAAAATRSSVLCFFQAGKVSLTEDDEEVEGGI